MKRFFETKARRVAIARRLWIGCVGLCLVPVFAAMTEAGTFGKLTASAWRAHVLAARYVRSGQWRADASAYVTQAEYLFYPSSGAGARLDLDLDD